jgi:hypothetical protein
VEAKRKNKNVMEVLRARPFERARGRSHLELGTSDPPTTIVRAHFWDAVGLVAGHVYATANNNWSSATNRALPRSLPEASSAIAGFLGSQRRSYSLCLRYVVSPLADSILLNTLSPFLRDVEGGSGQALHFASPDARTLAKFRSIGGRSGDRKPLFSKRAQQGRQRCEPCCEPSAGDGLKREDK